MICAPLHFLGEKCKGSLQKMDLLMGKQKGLLRLGHDLTKIPEIPWGPLPPFLSTYHNSLLSYFINFKII